AVNPEDMRYKDLVGKMLKLPLTDREIPIVADSYVDKEFGTGCVKITPAHDPNDFEVGKRHNLPEINILHDDATISLPGSKYDQMERYAARKVIIEDLKNLGLLVKVVPHSHNVGTHDRCKTTVEPMIKQQWFVKMEEMAKPAVEAIKSGELKFVPENFGKTYLHWLDHIRDWCISRQLWWGHRIPAYYCDQCGEIVVSGEQPGVCPKCGSTHLTQDEDTLDTWFSSALWPFSTLGWPDQTKDLDYFYPTDVLVTGYDIIFFWVIRMVFSGLEQTGKLPFHTVLMHGLVRDSEGRKMSKSLGNGIDPLEVIDQYGADALRMTLITGNAPGNDMRFYWERVEASRNFANKVWNASRFIMMNLEKVPETSVALQDLTMADRWILSKVNTLAKDVTENLDKYDLGIALQKVYDFIWEEFCDWYIEMVKPRLWNEEDHTRAAAIWTLKTVLIQSLKLLHPYMPFVTEEIFCNLQEEEPSIMISNWPQYRQDWNFQAEEQAVETIKEAVRSIRNVRTSMNVPPSKKAKVYVVSENQGLLDLFEHSKVFFAMLGYASEVYLQKDKTGIAEDAVSAVIPQAAIYMPFAELVDLGKEIERLTKEKEHLTKELARVDGMLSNERFVSKAPAEKIAEEKEKRDKYVQMMEQVEERLSHL
ncbi:MAG: valine--tRNA ligase, partial [Hungatella sp.]